MLIAACTSVKKWGTWFESVLKDVEMVQWESLIDMASHDLVPQASGCSIRPIYTHSPLSCTCQQLAYTHAAPCSTLTSRYHSCHIGSQVQSSHDPRNSAAMSGDMSAPFMLTCSQTCCCSSKRHRDR